MFITFNEWEMKSGYGGVSSYGLKISRFFLKVKPEECRF